MLIILSEGSPSLAMVSGFLWAFLVEASCTVYTFFCWLSRVWKRGARANFKWGFLKITLQIVLSCFLTVLLMGKSCVANGLCFLLSGGSQLGSVCERLKFVCLNAGSDLAWANHCRLSQGVAQFSLHRLPWQPPGDTSHLHKYLYLLPPCYGIVEKAAKLAWILILHRSLLFQTLVQCRNGGPGVMLLLQWLQRCRPDMMRYPP